jgi:hypothetical protein
MIPEGKVVTVNMAWLDRKLTLTSILEVLPGFSNSDMGKVTFMWCLLEWWLGVLRTRLHPWLRTRPSWLWEEWTSVHHAGSEKTLFLWPCSGWFKILSGILAGAVWEGRDHLSSVETDCETGRECIERILTLGLQEKPQTVDMCYSLLNVLPTKRQRLSLLFHEKWKEHPEWWERFSSICCLPKADGGIRRAHPSRSLEVRSMDTSVPCANMMRPEQKSWSHSTKIVFAYLVSQVLCYKTTLHWKELGPFKEEVVLWFREKI